MTKDTYEKPEIASETVETDTLLIAGSPMNITYDKGKTWVCTEITGEPIPGLKLK